MGVSGGLVRVQQQDDEGAPAAEEEKAPQVADPTGGVEIDFNLGWE
jgi:hypothetical protein